MTVKDNAALTPEDMSFRDAVKLDFRIAHDAAVFKKVPGFETIPFEKIGLYRDTHRTEIPAHPSGHTNSEWHRRR